MSDRVIDELAGVEFGGSLAIAFELYARELFTIARAWQHELDMASSDAEAAMSELHGHPLLFGLDAKVKARRVARRLKRAQALAHGLAEEAQRFNRAYRRHFLGS
ncbi:hypothetical protein Acsp04_60870 [Actinomadura sp. NBRC 104425]|uniref:hypothetical protein n=1 Tax=Actinomadura sp. NBRC 104425 TaxID=3032204 RepID=UPI0024A193F8|nr:hypothetical protein [Actinomadura sp. NBRC 104425]GLZ15852.1 hypothetical protein Acsp04_60870 [Actinomadura sp. NBRC 104425]